MFCLAYRGVAKERSEKGFSRRGKSPRKNKPQSQRNFPKKRHASARKQSTDWPTNKNYVRQEGKGVHEDRKRLVALQNKLLRLAKEYRSYFSVESATAELKVPNIHAGKESSNQREVLETSINYLKLALDDMHRSDTPIEWSQIEQTEDLFRGISRTLQETIMLPTYLCRIDENTEDTPLFVDLAENALRNLLSLRSERAILVEATKSWGSKLKNVPVPSADQQPRATSPLKVWISTVFDSFHSNPASEEIEPSGTGLLAHEDPSLGGSQNLFCAVMECVSLQGQVEDRKTIALTAGRLVQLLDLMPSTMWKNSTDLVKLVLDMQSRAGTLENAEICREIWTRTNRPDKLPFHLILSAFVEAARYEEDEEVLEAVARECLGTLSAHWNQNLPKRKTDRLKQAALVLQCFSLANMGEFPEMIEEAESLIKRALGGADFDALMNNVFSEKTDRSRKNPDELLELNDDVSTSTNPHVFPLLNFLVHLYAKPYNDLRFEKAKKILHFMVKKGSHIAGRGSTYPDVETCKIVLDGIWETHGNAQKIDSDDRVEDLDYMFALLDYLLAQGDAGGLPDKDVFLSTFRLLKKINPPDVGEKAEHLLSMMEASNFYSSTSPESFDYSLSFFHRVLGCWLEAAKMGKSDDASRHSLALLDRLDVQSRPALLRKRDTSNTVVDDLYQVKLEPTARSYNLVLNILYADGSNMNEKRSRVFFEVFDRMAKREYLADTPETNNLLRKCMACLPESDEKEQVGIILKNLGEASPTNT